MKWLRVNLKIGCSEFIIIFSLCLFDGVRIKIHQDFIQIFFQGIDIYLSMKRRGEILIIHPKIQRVVIGVR
jgi:hypothetical protein